MDLLAPWKMCLQCLPISSSDPPPPPLPSTVLPLHTASEGWTASASTKNSSENDLQDGEKPSFSDSSLAQDHEHQDLPLSDYAKDVASLGYVPPAGMNRPAGGDEGKVEAHHQHSHHQNENTMDTGFAPSMPSHVQGHHMASLPLETSHSTPPDFKVETSPHGFYKDDGTAMNGSSGALETSQSEPIDGVGTVRVRRRDQLKHQLKDLRNQLKQGGQHLKEEGSKHLQSMVSTINKQSPTN